MTTSPIGLWGTSDPKRVMVTLEQYKPETILGYAREVAGFKWVAEGDPQNRPFDTPREAAQHGYALLWREPNGRKPPTLSRRAEGRK